MTNKENGRDGDPWVARVELDVVDDEILGGYQWRYRLSVGAREEWHEMEEMTRAFSLFEASLRGALHIMDRIPEGCPVTVAAPEHPLILGLSRWICTWHRNGWRNRDGDPVCHQRLWSTLWSTSVRRGVEWVVTTSTVKH